MTKPYCTNPLDEDDFNGRRPQNIKHVISQQLHIGSYLNFKSGIYQQPLYGL